MHNEPPTSILVAGLTPHEAVMRARLTYPPLPEERVNLVAMNTAEIGLKACEVRQSKGPGALTLHRELKLPWSVCLLANDFASAVALFTAGSAVGEKRLAEQREADRLRARICEERNEVLENTTPTATTLAHVRDLEARLVSLEQALERAPVADLALGRVRVQAAAAAARAEQAYAMASIGKAGDMRTAAQRLELLEAKLELLVGEADAVKTLGAEVAALRRLLDDQVTILRGDTLREVLQLTTSHNALVGKLNLLVEAVRENGAAIQALSENQAEVTEFLDEQGLALEQAQAAAARATDSIQARACRWWERNWFQVVGVSWVIATLAIVIARISK